MILTVTANPMVEMFMMAPAFTAGRAHRLSDRPRLIATGRPLNTARALRDLGEDVLAVVALGGSAGRQIEELLEQEHLKARIVALRRESRRGVTIHDGEGNTTTVYGPSPTLSDAEVQGLLSAVRCAGAARAVVAGGTVARDDVLEQIAGLGLPLVVDATGPALVRALASTRVLLAKPNLREARETFGVRTPLEALDVLSERGAQNAIVTDEGRDAWFRIGGATLRARPPAVTVRHAVGCGDAVCAGFLHAKGNPPARVAAFAVACGSYAATHDGVASLDRPEIEAMVPRVEVEQLS